MAKSLIYRNALLYESAMRALYGRHYSARSQAVADLITPGSSVLDLCCGPALVYHRHLRHKQVRYLGLDINARFIAGLRSKGGAGEVWNLQDARELPPADFVVMQASLYHFLPDPTPVVDRMLRAARREAIIAEPIRNLADARVPLLSALARSQTDPGAGRQPHRFTEQSLDAFFTRYADRVRRSFLIPGGREKIYVLSA